MQQNKKQHYQPMFTATNTLKSLSCQRKSHKNQSLRQSSVLFHSLQIPTQFPNKKALIQSIEIHLIKQAHETNTTQLPHKQSTKNHTHMGSMHKQNHENPDQESNQITKLNKQNKRW
jgi:hypothetical protein